MEGDGDKKTTNQQADEIRLIDISSEDDFLIASPIFDSLEDLRLSVNLGNMNEQRLSKLFEPVEVKNAAAANSNNNNRVFQRGSMEPGRPSYIRKSLAWDTAFFNSSGVLDPEELSIVNKGLKIVDANLLPCVREDVRVRRSDDEPESTVESDHFSWKSLEVDLLEDMRTHRLSKMSNAGVARCPSGLPNIPSKKKVTGSENKVKSLHTTMGQCSNLQESERNRNKILANPRILLHTATAKGGESSIHMSPSSAGKIKRFSSGSNLENITTKIRAGHGISTRPPKSPSSFPVVCSSYEAHSSSSSSFKSPLNPRARRTDSANCKLASSASSNKDSVQSQGVVTFRATLSQGTRLPNLHGAKESLRRSYPVSAESSRNHKPSGLRMPSPKIGYFGEEKPKLPKVEGGLQFHSGLTTTKRSSTKFQPSRAEKEIRNTKKIVLGSESCSKARKIGSGERDRRKLDLGSSLNLDGRRNKGVLSLKYEVGVENSKGKKLDKASCNIGDQINNGLSRYFEGMDLRKGENNLENKNILSKRTPLREKPCVGNKFPMESTPQKSATKFFTSIQEGSDKENS